MLHGHFGLAGCLSHLAAGGAARLLVRLLYIRIQIDDQVADSYVPLIIVVLEVGSCRRPGVRHLRSVATV